ncbi:MAG TPA: long-chain fatty acid--CoA ligase [Chitinophagaceae bacterium]|nr:long-chain fatty acid--CoA ligase [Chitinophagaceae bacterium]
MQQPTRLFDCLDYQLEKNPLPDMFAAKEGGTWKKYSTHEVYDLVNQLATGLAELGISANDMSVEGRDKVAIISKNRPEWLMLDLAVQKIGGALVPIYPTINVNELQFILNDSQSKVIFVNDEELYLKVKSIKDYVPSLQHIFTFEHVPNAVYWKDCLRPATEEKLTALKNISSKIKPSDIATIIYTSGTTGTPKGVMLSHNNIISNIVDSNCVFQEIGVGGKRALSFLPLNHIFERMVSYIYIYNSVAVYYAESMETIGENLKEVKPLVFTTVPRLLEKVYERIMAKAATLTGIKKNLFNWALSLGLKYDINKNMGLWYNIQLGLANKLVFSKWRDALGANVQSIVTGSAACQVKLLRVFTAAKVPILEGYGLTETSPVISVNRLDPRNRMFGTVGTIIDNVEVKIAEDGEILCKGPNVMMGYYKRPDLTEEVIKDGWFHTGDIGVLLDNPRDPANKFLKITDRKKEIFKTSGGKYVAPQPIENKMKESKYIEQMMVIGAGEKFTGALIVPAFNPLKEWCSEHGISYNGNEGVIKNEKVQALIKDTVERYNQNFNQVEQIKKFELLPREWSVEGGELTPTLKLKRKVILEKYRDAVERIYS